MTARERFEAWFQEHNISNMWLEAAAWHAYQAGSADGEREAVRACAEIIEDNTAHNSERFIKAAYPKHFKP